VKITSISTDGITPQAPNAAKSGEPNAPALPKAKIGGDGSPASDSIGIRSELPGGFTNESTANEKPVVINGLGVGLKFSVDKETNTHVIEVVDLKTGEVIRQIPPKEVVSFLRAVRLDKGVLVSRRL
jgi:flagellar protein FlaG